MVTIVFRPATGDTSITQIWQHHTGAGGLTAAGTASYEVGMGLVLKPWLKEHQKS